jgi:MoaD family protein
MIDSYLITTLNKFINFFYILEEFNLNGFKISFLSLLVDIIGKEEIYIKDENISTIREIIEMLKVEIGKEFESAILTEENNLKKYIIVGLNGEDIRSYDGLDTLLTNGDEISFLPAIAGG